MAHQEPISPQPTDDLMSRTPKVFQKAPAGSEVGPDAPVATAADAPFADGVVPTFSDQSYQPSPEPSQSDQQFAIHAEEVAEENEEGPSAAETVGAAFQQENEEGPSAAEIVGAAFQQENATLRLLDHYTRKEFPVDDDFDFEATVKSPEIAARLKALPDVAIEDLGESLSQDHLLYLLGRVEDDWGREQLLQRAGAGGLGARILAAVIDPVDIAASMLTLGATKFYTLGKIGTAAAVGTSAAAGAVAAEGVLAGTSPFRDGSDVAFAGMTALALGAPIGYLMGGDAVSKLARDAYNDARLGVVDKNYTEGGVDKNYTEGGVGLFARHDPMHLARSAEARANELALEGFAPKELAYHTKLWSGQEIPTYTNILHGSPDAITNSTSHRVLETGVPLADTLQKKSITAEGRANQIHRTQATQMYRAIDYEFKSWAKEHGYGKLRRIFGTEAGAAFREDIGRAVKGEPGVSPQAARAASTVREVLAEQLNLMKKAGVKGADEVEFNPNYLPRVHKAGAWREAVDEFGEENIVRLFREGFQQGDESLDYEVAQKLSELYVRSVTRRSFNIDVGAAHGFDLEDTTALRDWFGDEADELIDALEAFNARNANPDGSKIKNLKRRAQFSENVGLDILTKSGDTKFLKMSDLMENDVGKVVDLYLRSTAGWIGLAKQANIKSKADLEAAIKGIRSRGADSGRHAQSQKEADAFDEVTKLITGQTLEADPDSLFNQVGRQARAYNFARVGGGFGWAQLAEIGPIIGNATFKEFFRAMPDFRKLFQTGRDGQLTDALARELDWMVGAGTDFVRNPAIAHFDEFGSGFGSTGLGKVMGAIDAPLQTAGRMTSVLAGMAPVNAWLQRMAARTSAFRMASLAKKYESHKDLPESLKRRFSDMGIDAFDLDEIWKNMRLHATFKGKKLTSLQTEKWDSRALDAWKMGMHRQMRRVVQENDIGNSFSFMHKEWGKIFTQFQSFMINAFNKQTLHGIAFRDQEVATAWLMSMFVGGLSYAAQSSLNYAAEPEELAKRLEPSMIARAAFMRAGWASILPMAIDSGLGMTGQDKLFEHARSSGMGTGPLEGNPTYAGARDMVNLAKLPGRLLLDDDYEFSQSDARQLARVTAFANVTGVRNVISLLSNDLPKVSQ